MGRETGISYAHHTRNFWVGCTKIGPGCDHCYAEAFDKRFPPQHWGPGVPRQAYLEGAARDLKAWNAKAQRDKVVRRVFLNTFSDTFDNEVPQEWRDFLFATIKPLHHLDFLIVTKRIGNAFDMLPADWGIGYVNVYLLATVTDQAELERDLGKLLAVPAYVRGLSIEPQLGPIRLPHGQQAQLQWVICGGESGAMGRARPFDLAWARSLRDDCERLSIPFWMKQFGAAPYDLEGVPPWSTPRAGAWFWMNNKRDEVAHMQRVEDFKDRHGADMGEWPEDLRVQRAPRE